MSLDLGAVVGVLAMLILSLYTGHDYAGHDPARMSVHMPIQSSGTHSQTRASTGHVPNTSGPSIADRVGRAMRRCDRATLRVRHHRLRDADVLPGDEQVPEVVLAPKQCWHQSSVGPIK